MKLLYINSGPAKFQDTPEYHSELLSGIKKEGAGFFDEIYVFFYLKQEEKNFAGMVYEDDEITIRFFKSDFIDIGSCHSKFGKYLHMLHPGKLFKLNRIISFLTFVIEFYDIDAIFSADPHLGGLIAHWLSRRTKKPFVVSLWNSFDSVLKYGDYTTSGMPRFVEKVIERFVFKQADMVWGMNDSLKSYAITNDAEPNKCFTVRISVSETHYDIFGRSDIREDLNLPEDSRIISLVSRLSPEKFPMDAIRAFQRIAKDYPSAYLLVAGDGPQYGEIENYLVEHGLSNRIFLLGAKDQEFLKNLFYSSDISLELLGGSSLVEACLGMSPVIAYNFDWHSELIKHKNTGFLTDLNDTGQLADAMRYLLDNRDEARILGENARKFALLQHGPDNIKKERMRLWTKLIKGDMAYAPAHK